MRAKKDQRDRESLLESGDSLISGFMDPRDPKSQKEFRPQKH